MYNLFLSILSVFLPLDSWTSTLAMMTSSEWLWIASFILNNKQVKRVKESMFHGHWWKETRKEKNLKYELKTHRRYIFHRYLLLCYLKPQFFFSRLHRHLIGNRKGIKWDHLHVCERWQKCHNCSLYPLFESYQWDRGRAVLYKWIKWFGVLDQPTRKCWKMS